MLLLPQEERKKYGSDDRLRDELKQLIQQVTQGKRNQIVTVQEARGLLVKFEEKDRAQAFQYFKVRLAASLIFRQTT